MELFFTLAAELVLVESYSTKVLKYRALKLMWIAILATSPPTHTHTHTLYTPTPTTPPSTPPEQKCLNIDFVEPPLKATLFP